MSLYPSPQGYSHAYPSAPAPAPVYQHGPPVNYSAPVYQHPQPAFPLHFSDPSSFRRDYAARLSELTMNSRPIIQTLSVMAQNYLRYADIVAECLQAHIRRVPPWMKLPAFYVLDAISKNVYDPYASKFSPFVVPLFLETYGQVDPSIRSKMEEMLVTWRTGSPSGKELFGIAAQVSLERQIWGNDTSSSVYDHSSRRPGHAPPMAKSQVLAELDVTLALKEQACHVNPYDSTAKNQVNVLHQLRRMVESGVSQEELQQILAQLRAMGRESAAAPPPPQPQVQAPPPNVYSGVSGYTTGLPQIPQHQQPAVQYGLPQVPQVVAGLPTIPGYGVGPSALASAVSSQSLVPSLTSTHDSLATSANMSGISDLFKSLVKAGLVGTGNTPVGAGSSSMEVAAPAPAPVETPEEVQEKAEKKLEEEKLEARRAYAKKILGLKIRLTTGDIARQRPQNISSMYEQLPMQCKQCALRFADSPIGKKQMQDHLDMHFRQNRRAKETVGRGHSRSWFISIDDWISEPLTNLKGKNRDNTRPSNAKAAAANEAAEREATLRASVVVVPAGDEAKSISCPVCKETLKSEFREEDEEWVWMNAVRVKNKIYHATCHAEMITSSTLAARLRTENSGSGIGSSRAGTPEAESRRSTPPKLAAQLKTKLRDSRSPTPDTSTTSLAGTKRKAEGDDPSADGVERTPPLKKAVVPAIAPAQAL